VLIVVCSGYTGLMEEDRKNKICFIYRLALFKIITNTHQSQLQFTRILIAALSSLAHTTSPTRIALFKWIKRAHTTSPTRIALFKWIKRRILKFVTLLKMTFMKKCSANKIYQTKIHYAIQFLRKSTLYWISSFVIITPLPPVMLYYLVFIFELKKKSGRDS
jgi:hypothetical protein